MKKSSLRTVKEKNRRLILRALLTEGGLSRIELAKQTGLSPSTITALVGELLAEGVVQESGLRAATAGRSRARTDHLSGLWQGRCGGYRAAAMRFYISTTWLCSVCSARCCPTTAGMETSC